MIEKNENCHIQVGSFNLTVLSDGGFPVTKDFFFADTPKEIIQHIPNEFKAPLNFLLIDTGKNKILIDAGFGEEYLPERGQLLKQLQEEKISPAEIHAVIITHGHLDHIGGISRDGAPVFPNAQHYIRKEEWDYWMGRPETLEYEKLSPLKNQVVFVSSDVDFHPGIRLLHTPGHTEGHLAVSISSKGVQLLVASDLLNDPVTLGHLPSHIAAEMDPEKGMQTRVSFLKKAYLESSQLFVCHYPFPGLGHLKEDNGVWTWLPATVLGRG